MEITRKMKHILLILTLLLSLTCSVFALDTYYTPIAHSADGIHADVYFGESGSSILKASAGMGGLEISAAQYNVPNDFDNTVKQDSTVVGFEWQMIPEIQVVPAVAIGIKDILAHLDSSPTFYAVVTKDLRMIDPSGTFSKLQFSFGYGSETLNGFFGSLNADISRFYVSGEFFNGKFNWGGGVKITDFIKVGYMNFDERSYVGASANFAF